MHRYYSSRNGSYNIYGQPQIRAMHYTIYGHIENRVWQLPSVPWWSWIVRPRVSLGEEGCSFFSFSTVTLTAFASLVPSLIRFLFVLRVEIFRHQ